MANDQKTQKIRDALKQLETANDAHWTEDGLPREGIIRKIAGDNTISRKDISDANPGFQRTPAEKPVDPAPEADPLDGGPEVAAVSGETKDQGGSEETNADPTKNTGDLMTEDEVRQVLEGRVKDAIQAVEDAQAAVRAANKAVIDRQNDLTQTRADYTREFPPMTPAENIKQYIASEMAQRAAAFGQGGIAPGSQIDAAMQRSNSRGWRRPSRVGVTQSGAAKVA